MANPRKFSEKIALHNQKQAEETAAFEQIMKEVIGATRGPKNHHLHINQSLGAYRAGSLPNVNQISNNSIDLQSALTSLEDMKQGREISADRIHRERGRHVIPHQSRRFAFENKRIDVSPYNSSYLSPPPDTNWRRTNSDSALHQSAMNPQDSFHGSNTPPNNRIFEIDRNLLHENDQLNHFWDPKKHHLMPLQQSRPKSCEVPGINIYPTQEDSGSAHVPISSNTGSLPDLTNLHFPSPLATPLDMDGDSLSPSPLQQQQHILGNSLGGGGSRHSSPGPSPSPSSRRRHHHNLTNLVIGSPRHHTQHQVRHGRPFPHAHYMQRPPLWSSHMEELTMDTNALSLETYQQQQTPQFGVYPQQQPQQTVLPQLSMGSYRSSSPAEHSCSAPTSPVSHSLSPSSSPGLGASSSYSDSTNYYQPLQHQLEQFKMIPDNTSNSSNVGSHNNTAMFLATVDSGGGGGGPDTSLLPQGFPPSSPQDMEMLYSLGSDPQLQSPTLYTKSPTPQTPTSIPDIILTAPGGEEPPLLRQDFAKELGCAISNMCGNPFDTPDFFSPEEALRAGLTPIDFEGLQILTDPPDLAPVDTEDAFRLEGS